MKNLSKLFIILTFLSFSQSGWAIDCFSNPSAGTLTDDAILACINEALAAQPITGLATSYSDAATAINEIVDVHERDQRSRNPNPEAIMATLSADSARVFYSESSCGHSVSDQTICDQMARLAALDSSGAYSQNFNCSSRGISHPACQQFVSAIEAGINDRLTGVPDCQANTETKLYCNDLVLGFLQTDRCDSNGPNSEQSDCTTYVISQFNTNGDRCHFSTWQGARPTSETAMQACAGDAVVIASSNGNGNGTGTNDDATGGGGDPSNEPPAADPNSELPQLADNIANEVFGGMPGNFSQANLDATTQVPGVDPRGPGGAAISAAANARVAGFNPGANTTPPGIVRAFPSTRGEPGGTPKAGGGSPGGGGLGAGGIGGAGGLGNNSAGGAAGGGGNSRGGGGGVSRYGNMAKSMNNGFIGTDGSPAGGSGTPAKERESAVDRQVKQAIAANNRNNIDKEALQRALNRNLGRAGNTQDLVMRSSYFPGHSEVYLWLHQRSDVLDEQGK